ncbi:MAG TPA: tetratricopeptide repeat protein [Geminicoccaceae bacterium]|nr:tetratricopeptide repeat protein [Geminicoccaceae bacterium]
MRYWRLKMALFLSTALIGTMLASASAPAHEPTAQATAAPLAGAMEPLYDNLGDLGHPVSTDSELAQKYFDQGLRWTYAFNHAAAVRAFQEAQRQDPNCAMCYWGEAFALGPNINAPMDAGATNPAVAAIEKAKAAAHHASAPEQALIEALALRYADDPNADRAALDQAYAEAMAAAYERFPEDPEVAVLYADAVMNTAPWDYWEADGVTPKGRIGEAIAAVEGVLADNPEHVGAIHLYIHLTEASTTPERAEPHADRLAELMPGAGHIVHMGGHTFYRIGRFHDSSEVNKQAVAADEAYLAKVDDQGYWRYGYHPHNVHFVMVSALMAGDAASAIEYTKRLDGKVSDEVAAQAGWVQAIKQGPYFVNAHLSDPATILALPDPGDRFPYVQAAWHYARGVAFVREGELEQARTEAARIADLQQRTDLSYPPDIDFVVADVMQIARHVLEGRIAQSEGDYEGAAKEFATALQIQDSLAYLEPPFWYYPVGQSLGAALLQAGKADEAAAAFAASLERVPNNGWALYGLMKAQEAQGDEAAAKTTRERFEQAWVGEESALDLSRL